MLVGRIGYRGLMSLSLATGISVGGAGGFGLTDSQAASLAAQPAATGSAIVLTQVAPQPAPCGPAPAAPCKDTDAKPKPKAKEKQRRLSPCGPGLAPCAETK